MLYNKRCVSKKVICVGIFLALAYGLIRRCPLGKEYTKVEEEEEQQVTTVRRKAVTEKEQTKSEIPEKNYKILADDICSSPKYDYENTPLAKYIEADITWNEEVSKKEGKSLSLEIDYHMFDFNDDGIEDYLLCKSGPLFNGNGNSVEIFIQEKEGIRLVLSMPMILHNSLSDHENLIVLDEKNNGYYAIVPPYKDFILRYDAEEEWYSGEVMQEDASGTDESQTETSVDETNEGTELKEEVMKGERYNNYFVNLEDLEKYHKILQYDICSSPKYDYKNTPLAEYVEEVKRRIEKKNGAEETARLKIDYHMFDFNDDGFDDYMLCVYGTRFTQDDEVAIFIQEEEGLRRVFYIDVELHDESLNHSKLTVLDEKTNGYYAIVPPYGNYILRYDIETEQYDFGVSE
ncbi:MAG: hypothetical protein K2O15_06440 [Lachnospiraceae bacterium]|nr:hypothetical protein [Lachnospiraceae bacterium]